MSVEISSASTAEGALAGVLRSIGGFEPFGAVVGEIDRHDPAVVGFTPSVDESVAFERVDRLEIAADSNPQSGDFVGLHQATDPQQEHHRSPANDQPAGLWIVDSRSLNILPPSQRMPNIARNVSGSNPSSPITRRRCPRPRGRDATLTHGEAGPSSEMRFVLP